MPTPSMRILVQSELYPPLVCGEGVFARNLSEGLANRGHVVQVVTASVGGTYEFERDGGMEIHRLPSVGNPLYPTFRLSLPVEGRLRGILEGFRPQCVQVNNPSWAGGKILDWAASRGVRSVATNHYHPATLWGNHAWLKPFSSLIGRFAGSSMAKFYRKADVVTAPSAFAAGRLGGLGVSGVRQISNGVDVERFHPARREPGVFAKWGIPAGAKVVLHHGRLYRSKRVDRILRAFESMPEDAWMVVSGEGPDRVRLMSIANDRTRFIGGVDNRELPTVLASADLFAIASPFELQGIVVLEAMASALPVVAMDAGALPELVVDEVNGFLCAADSPDRFADRMREGLADAHRLGEGARRTVLVHALENVIDRFETLFQST